jgi:hypothetical protein
LPNGTLIDEQPSLGHSNGNDGHGASVSGAGLIERLLNLAPANAGGFCLRVAVDEQQVTRVVSKGLSHAIRQPSRRLWKDAEVPDARLKDDRPCNLANEPPKQDKQTPITWPIGEERHPERFAHCPSAARKRKLICSHA